MWRHTRQTPSIQRESAETNRAMLSVPKDVELQVEAF
jgi:hypothetical protein